MSFLVKITKNYGSFCLKVHLEGEGTLSLLGASGSGKTLTLKCIAGTIKPDEGIIRISDKILFDSENNINLPPQERNVGYLFQDYALFPNMTVRKNVSLGLNKIKNGEEKDKRINEMISLFQLDEVANHYPHQLSGGQKQRTALARILVSNPDILLLDEPFSSLDEHLRTRLELEMKNIMSTFGKDVILVTHNRDEAYMLTEYVSVINKGENIIYGNTKEIFIDPQYLSVASLTGCKNIYKAQKIGDHSLFVPELGININMNNRSISDDITHVGIRAHSFSPNIKENNHEIIVKDIVEEPFEHLIRFRYHNQLLMSEDVYYRLSKNTPLLKEYNHLGFKEDDVLLLRDK